jgi:hypothetical protein
LLIFLVSQKVGRRVPDLPWRQEMLAGRSGFWLIAVR